MGRQIEIVAVIAIVAANRSSESPTSMPSTWRSPSRVTPIATTADFFSMKAVYAWYRRLMRHRLLAAFAA
jgi:hypothetical protein